MSNQEACTYCGAFYPIPVSDHHTTEECDAMIAEREGEPPPQRWLTPGPTVPMLRAAPSKAALDAAYGAFGAVLLNDPTRDDRRHERAVIAAVRTAYAVDTVAGGKDGRS